MDPAELRRMNFLGKDDFPYVTQTGADMDTGDYEAALDKVLEIVDVDAFGRSKPPGSTIRQGHCWGSAGPPMWRSPTH